MNDFLFSKKWVWIDEWVNTKHLPKPNKNLQHDQEKNWNSRIDWYEKLGIDKIVLQDIDEICISVDPDKKNQEYGIGLRQVNDNWLIL